MTETLTPITAHLHALARHMAWADATVWDAVFAVPQAAESDSRIPDTLHHIHLVQHIFLQAWRRETFNVRERSAFSSLEAIAAWGREADRGILSFIEAASLEELEREFRMPWAAHFEQSSSQPAGAHTLGESALQVFLHTQHHRGQVCTRLRDVGVTPPTVDFIVWLWSGRPPSR